MLVTHDAYEYVCCDVVTAPWIVLPVHSALWIVALKLNCKELGHAITEDDTESEKKNIKCLLQNNKISQT